MTALPADFGGAPSRVGPMPMPIAGAVADDQEAASVRQMAAVSGWMRLFSDRTRRRARAPQD